MKCSIPLIRICRTTPAVRRTAPTTKLVLTGHARWLNHTSLHGRSFATITTSGATGTAPAPQTDGTPNEWIEDANAELAEWFGEANPNANKSTASKSTTTTPSNQNKGNLTEFLLKQKRSQQSSTIPPQQQQPTVNHVANQQLPSERQLNQLLDEVEQDLYTPSARSTHIVHQHTHTHHHYYSGGAVAPSPSQPSFTTTSPTPTSPSSSSPSIAFSTRAIAEAFALRWIGLWNSRDLDGVMALFGESCTFVSPRALSYVGRPQLNGKTELRGYWSTALSKIQTIHFDYDGILLDSEQRTLQVIYRGRINQGHGYSAVELWRFDTNGKIVHGEAYEGRLWD